MSTAARIATVRLMSRSEVESGGSGSGSGRLKFDPQAMPVLVVDDAAGGVAAVIARVFREQGRPVGYITGQEDGGVLDFDLLPAFEGEARVLERRIGAQRRLVAETAHGLAPDGGGLAAQEALEPGADTHRRERLPGAVECPQELLGGDAWCRLGAAAVAAGAGRTR